jgi:hypothetical protein
MVSVTTRTPESRVVTVQSAPLRALSEDPLGAD